ncbi:hypothetical protein ACHAXT_012781 [Thalassiosira profunda]
MRGNKAMTPRLPPPALLSCLMAAIIPAGNALLPSHTHNLLGTAKRHHRVALKSAIGGDNNQGGGKGANPFDGMRDLFHQLLSNGPDLPSIAGVSELASSLPHSVSDLMSNVNVPEINIPELLAAAVPPQSQRYTDVRDFDPNLGRDIEEALRLASILDALGGTGAEQVKYAAPSRSAPLVVPDNTSAREEQFSMFREANNNVAMAGERPRGRSTNSRDHPREDGVGKGGVLFRENGAADWNGVAMPVGDRKRSKDIADASRDRKDKDVVDARSTRPSMFQETNLADRAPAPPSAAARANDTAGGRDGVGFANAADVKPVSNRATVRRGLNAHTRNASPVAHYPSADRPPPPMVDRREYATSQVVREDDPSEPSRRDTTRSRENDTWDAYEKGGWSEYGGNDFKESEVRDGRGTSYASRNAIFSEERRRVHITDSALELAASLKLDVHEIYIASGKATIEEEDVRDYLDRRYEQLFSTLSEQRVGHQKASMPNRSRLRGAQYRNGRRVEGGNRRRERSNFVAEEMEWEALYDSWRRDEGDYRRKEPQFRPYAHDDAKDRPGRRASRPQQRQQQNQRQRDARELDRDPYFEQRDFGAQRRALPRIASVPISQLVSHPRLERMPQSAPESFDIADYRPTSQAEFRQTYHSQPQRNGFQAPNQQSFDSRSAYASPQERGNQHHPGRSRDEVELSYEEYNAYFAPNAQTAAKQHGNGDLGV